MSLQSEVPDGTVQEVLNWVGDDLARANAAYQVEVIGAGRSTLITKLEAIASAPQEAPAMTDPQPVVDDETEYVEPDQPDVVLDTKSNDVHVSEVHRRHADVEVPDYDDLNLVDEIASDPCDYFQVAGSPQGAVFSFNGAVYGLQASQVASFKSALDSIVVGLAL